MTVQAFAMPASAYINPSSYERLEGNDLYVWLLSHVFADKKFMSIFTMLFGASVVMLSQKARKEQLRSSDLQYKRFIFLGIIGMFHAYLVYFQDILLLYAICGLLTFIFRSKKSGVQVRAGVIFLIIGSLISLLMGYSTPIWEPGEYEANMAQYWQPNAEQHAEEIDYYTSSWERQILTRAPRAFSFQTRSFVLENFWRISGCILIGMALYKRRVFKGKQSTKYYLKMIGYGIGLGLPLVIIGVLLNFNYDWDFRMYFYFSQFNYWGSILMALGYIGLIMLICKTSTRSFIAKRLADVGRMSLSNYILQSLIFTYIFYGQGMALFGDLDRSAQAVFVLGIGIANIIFSWAWLSFFRFGPLEWLWRSLTYGKAQPMIKG